MSPPPQSVLWLLVVDLDHFPLDAVTSFALMSSVHAVSRQIMWLSPQLLHVMSHMYTFPVFPCRQVVSLVFMTSSAKSIVMIEHRVEK